MVGFGKDIHEKKEKEYEGKWVVVYPVGINNSFAGKVQIEEENNLKLCPRYKVDWENYSYILDKQGSYNVPKIGSAIDITSLEKMKDYAKVRTMELQRDYGKLEKGLQKEKPTN